MATHGSISPLNGLVTVTVAVAVTVTVTVAVAVAVAVTVAVAVAVTLFTLPLCLGRSSLALIGCGDGQEQLEFWRQFLFAV